MKKLLVVLTILVLVAGFAFADISGKVAAEYTFGFSKADARGLAEDYSVTAGYAKPGTGKLDATFTLDSQSAGFTGENMPYVDLAVTAKISGYYGYSSEHYDKKTAKTLSFTYKISKFNIVGDGWSINLLKSSAAALDLAVSAIDYETFHWYTPEQNDAYYSLDKPFDYADGVSVTYKDYVLGVGFNTTDLKDKYAAISVEIKTPEYAFGDVKVQAGAGFSQTADVKAVEAKVSLVTFETDTDAKKVKPQADVTWVAISGTLEDGLPNSAGVYKKTVAAVPAVPGGFRVGGASAKVAYDTEAVKASVAVDAIRVSGDEKIYFDLAANLQVAPVVADVYFNNNGAAAVDAKDDTNFIPLGIENYLSARVKVALGDVIESVPVTLTVTTRDLVNAARQFDVEVNTTAVKDFDITAGVYDIDANKNVYVEADVKYTGIENVEIEADAGYHFDAKVLFFDLDAKYTAEMFTAEAEVILASDFTDTFFACAASVESDKLIEGATLSAKLEGVDFGTALADLRFRFGSAALTLGCTVEF